MICRFFFPVFVSKHFRSFEIAFLVYLITIKQQKKTTTLCDTSPCQWLRESSSILSDFACYIFIYNRRRYIAYLNFTLTIKTRVLFTSSSFRTNSIYAGSIAWLCSRATSNTTLTPFGPLQINMGRCQVAYSKKLNNNIIIIIITIIIITEIVITRIDASSWFWTQSLSLLRLPGIITWKSYRQSLTMAYILHFLIAVIMMTI